MENEIYDLPEWAACAVINGDFDGLNPEEVKMVKQFLAFMDGAIMSIENSGSFFCWRPVFGKACMCVTMKAVYIEEGK